MTTLEDLSSSLPKPWLVINAASVNAGPGGGGVSSAVWSQIASKSVIGSLTPQSITSGAAAVGSLVLPPLPIGAVVRMTLSGNLGLDAGLNCQFAPYINGAIASTAFTQAAGGSGVATTGVAQIHVLLTVRAAGLAAISLLWNSGGSAGPTVVLQGSCSNSGFAFNPALLTNTLDVFAQFSGTGSSTNFVTQIGLLEITYPNL
jgi:hypothetical protein